MRTPPRISHKRNIALSISERTEIVKQHKSGVSITQLHKNFDRDRRTIRKFINLSKKGNELSSPLKSGRPKPSKRFVSKVKSIVDKENTKEEGCLTYNLVHDQLKRKGYNCSIKKVVRVLHNSGYTRMAKARNCDLTERHKALRVALANELLSLPPQKLDNIIWTDEKLFMCGVHGVGHFFIGKKGGPKKIRCRNRRWYGGKGVMAWMGISKTHGFFLHIFKPIGGVSHADAHKVKGETILRAFKKRQ